jgi:hypothetical protein
MVRENMVAVVVMVKLVLLGDESEQRRFRDFFGELVMMSGATGLGFAYLASPCMTVHADALCNPNPQRAFEQDIS